MRTIFVFFCLTVLAFAQSFDNVTVVSHRAWAKGDYVKPIHVEIKLRNGGQKASPQLIAELTLTPDLPKTIQQPQDPPVSDMTSPTTMTQVIPSIPAGQTVTIDFITMYKASEDFSSTTRFYAMGVLPDDFRGSNCPVHYKVNLHE